MRAKAIPAETRQKGYSIFKRHSPTVHGSDLGTTKVLPDWIFDFSKVVKFCQKVPNFNLFLDQKKPYLAPLFYFKEKKIISF